MSLRFSMRERTQAAHRRLDALWTIGRLRERGSYTQFLRATAAALVPLEVELEAAGVGALLGDWPARSRAALIQADLEGLEAARFDCAMPMLEDEAAVFGALYVLEGSRLGGSMIAREVAQSADPAVLSNRRYLGHGQVGRLWNGFLEQLERRPATETELDGLCRGALATFALFEAAAREVLVIS